MQYPILLTVVSIPYAAYTLCIVFRIELIEDVCNISQRPELKTRGEIWPGNNFPSVDFNPIIVFRSFVEFITHLPAATYLTRTRYILQWGAPSSAG